MSASATLTVRLSGETKHRLAELADKTRRTSSFLAGEAIAAYVARELEIISGIEAGMAEIRAGNTIPHDEVDADIRAIIEAASVKS